MMTPLLPGLLTPSLRNVTTTRSPAASPLVTWVSPPLLSPSVTTRVTRRPPDSAVTVLGQPSPRDAGVIAFTAHSVVFADVTAAWVRDRLPAGDLSAPLSPDFLCSLAGRLGRRIGSLDMLTVAPPAAGPLRAAFDLAAAALDPRPADRPLDGDLAPADGLLDGYADLTGW